MASLSAANMIIKVIDGDDETDDDKVGSVITDIVAVVAAAGGRTLDRLSSTPLLRRSGGTTASRI